MNQTHNLLAKLLLEDIVSASKQEVQDDLKVSDVLNLMIAEYNTIRGEIALLQNQIHQLTLSALASIAGLATLVITLLNGDSLLLITFLLILPFPFAAMAIAYVGQVGQITNLAQYLSRTMIPKLNKLIDKTSFVLPFEDIFEWEKYNERAMPKTINVISKGFWGVGQGLIVYAPMPGSLILLLFTIANGGIALVSWQVVLLIVNVFLVILIPVISVFALRRHGVM